MEWWYKLNKNAITAKDKTDLSDSNDIMVPQTSKKVFKMVPEGKKWPR